MEVSKTRGNRRRAGRRPCATAGAAELLRRTFYYLKGEQLILAYSRLNCEAA